MEIRAICTDIDGTLLDSRRELSSRTIASIKRISQKIPIILASSRMPSAMRHLQQELSITDHPMICYNGGYPLCYTKDSSSPEVFDSVSISPAICSSIFSMAQGTDIHVSLYQEDHWYAPRVDQWTQREERITKVKALVGHLDPVLKTWETSNTGAHKVMCMGPEQEIRQMEQLLKEKHSDDIHVYFSRPTYLEIAPKSISKATALKLITSKLYNLQMSDVMAFGDNYNDIDMLEAVGLGIAVANAKEEVKRVAREVTLPSVEDGVAIAIEKYCL